jgi:NAD(P)-dependent dehydrogenase (short-subunit alcohol dehydrogenase family)
MVTADSMNNAGIAGPEEPLHEVEVAGIDDTLAVNLRGPVVLANHALPLLLDRPGGRVVDVSSGMGALGEGTSGSYGLYRISKAGIDALSVYLHGEYGDRGLIANSACPGWVRTDLGSPDAPNSPAEGADTPAWLATFRPGAPSGRFRRDREPIAW